MREADVLINCRAMWWPSVPDEFSLLAFSCSVFVFVGLILTHFLFLFVILKMNLYLLTNLSLSPLITHAWWLTILSCAFVMNHCNDDLLQSGFGNGIY